MNCLTLKRECDIIKKQILLSLVLGLCLSSCVVNPVFASLPVYDEPVKELPTDYHSSVSGGLPQFDGQLEMSDYQAGILSVPPKGNKFQYWADKKIEFINDYYTAYPSGFSGWKEYGSYTSTQAVGWDYLKKTLGISRTNQLFEEYGQYASSYENGGKLIVYSSFDWYFGEMVTNVILLGTYSGTSPGDTLNYSYASSSQTGSSSNKGNWWSATGGSGQVHTLYTSRTIISEPAGATWSGYERFHNEYTVSYSKMTLNPSKSSSSAWKVHLLGNQAVTVSSPHSNFGPDVGILVGYYDWEPDSSNLPADKVAGNWPFIEETPVSRHIDTITKSNPLYFTDEPINWDYVRYFGKENIPVVHTFNDTYSNLTGEHVYWFYIIYGTEKKQVPQVSLFGVSFYGGVPEDVPGKINFSPKKHVLISSSGQYQFYTDNSGDYYPPGAGLLAYNLFPGDAKRPDGKYTSSLENPGLKGLLCDFIPKDLTYIYKAGQFFRDGDYDIPPAYLPVFPDTDLTEGDTGAEDNIIVAFLRRLFVPDPDTLIDKLSLEDSVSGITAPAIMLANEFNDLYNFDVYDGFPPGIVIWGADFADTLNPIFSQSVSVPLVNTNFSFFSLSRVLSGVSLTGLMIMSLIRTLLSFFTGGNE